MQTYVLKPITDFRVLPDTVIPAEYLSNQIQVTTCPKEFVPATCILKTDVALSSVTLTIPDLQGTQGVIPSSAIDVRVVKCWYQWGDIIVIPPNQPPLLLPELLLKDDTLVNVDTSTKKNYLKKHDTGDYILITNNDTFGGPPTPSLNVLDSDTLLPFSMPANSNKQLWFTIHPPENTPAGEYIGTITILEQGALITTLSLKVEVLPFILPDSIVEHSIYYISRYYNPYINGTLGCYFKNHEQLLAELINMNNHGITNPTCSQYTYNTQTNLPDYMNTRLEAGLSNDTIFYSALEILPTDNISTLVTKVLNIKNFLHDNFGTTQLYVYAQDEQDMDTPEMRARVQAVHDIGVKVFNALGSNLAVKVADILDLCNQADVPNPNIAELYHSYGNQISNYGNPQCGEEKPLKYRRNYGITMWQADFDKVMDFAFMYGRSLMWDDWLWRSSNYKQHCFVYPTSNGVVDTMAYEGYREAVNDTKYLTALIQEIPIAQSQGKDTTVAEDFLVALKTMNISTMDLDAIRNQIISHILILKGFVTPEIVDDTKLFTIQVNQLLPEDLTTYTKQDPYTPPTLTVTQNKVAFNSLQNQSQYLCKAKTLRDFTMLWDGVIMSQQNDSGNPGGLATIMFTRNPATHTRGQASGNDDGITIVFMAYYTDRHILRMWNEQSPGTYCVPQQYDFVLNTHYWFKFQRIGTTFVLSVYPNETRNIPIWECTLSPPAGQTWDTTPFQYVSAFAGAGYNNNYNSTGYFQNFVFIQ